MAEKESVANRTMQAAPTLCRDGLTGSMTIIRKGGEIVCIPDKAPGLSPIVEPKPKTDVSSYSQTYKPHSSFSGMDKPLEPYRPNAFRSQNKSAPFKPPGRNASQVHLGSRKRVSTKETFTTTTQGAFIRHKGCPVGWNNPGIVSMQTRWLHRKSDK